MFLYCYGHQYLSLEKRRLGARNRYQVEDTMKRTHQAYMDKINGGKWLFIGIHQDINNLNRSYTLVRTENKDYYKGNDKKQDYLLEVKCLCQVHGKIRLA